MAGEIQLNSTTMATESSGSITAQLDTIRPNTTNGSLTLQGDSSDVGVTGLTIDSSGNATFAGSANNLGTVTAGTISGGTIGSSVVFPAGHIIQMDSSQTQAAQTVTTLTDLTGLSTSMTITSGNKVFISASVMYGGANDNYGYINVCDGSNNVIYQSNWATGSQVNASMPMPVLGGDTRGIYHVHHTGFQYLWTPGVTSITVKLRAAKSYGSSNMYINRPHDNTNVGYIVGGISSLTIMEVQA